MTRLEFPKGFVFGTATSSYQIEGAAHEDGRGESIWDRFARVPGKVEDGTNGDVACDHYHRFKDDIGLMRELGLHAYRFSTAWPRVFPDGRGQVNQKGVDFYSRLVDALLEAGITPYLTLYHWDLPQKLQDEGGWAARSTVEAFATFADVMSRALGDRVSHWITHNEPWCAGMLSHQVGRHAPGLTDWGTALIASHHLLLSHGRAVPILRANAKKGAEVGITLNLTPAEPASPSLADREACRFFDGYFNRWFLDPIYGRKYPADMVEDYAAAGYFTPDMPFVREGDLTAIAADSDFLGVNYYVRDVSRSKVPEAENLPRTVHLRPEVTEMDWEVYPEGLFEILTRVHLTYRPRKLYVTENGAAYSEGPDERGRVNDARRVAFVRDHLREAHRAIQAGAPLAGYFLWSLLDNYEWDRGYSQRFGITWVDYDTQRRILKDSARYYQEVIARNALEI